ncbi:MAG TPA: hypothetical protein VFY12_02545, partial [Arenimonas sp.]|nr:hypothetical protein [Arenimonas sp.]
MWLLAGVPAAAAAWAGSPPFTVFTPDIDVYPQHFGVAQDADGIVYLGSVDGVLEFDGERWSLLRLPNRELVRSLAVDGSRVFVGGYNSFGYLDRNDAGELVYHPLEQRFAAQLAGREFADIWGIAIAPEGVYFRAVRDVFLWNPGDDTQAHWHRPERFGMLLHHRGRTLLQFREEGVRVRSGAGWEPLPGSAHLTTLIYRMLPLADGGLLTLGSDGRWWRIGDDGIREQAMPAGLPPSSHFEHGLALSDGSLALAGGDGQVAIVSAALDGYRQFRLDNAFLSGVHPEQGGGFLVASTRHLFRVGWPAPWSMVDATRGVEGSVNSITQLGDDFYLGTSVGALRLRADPVSGIRAERLPWSSDEVYDVLALPSGAWLAAHAHRLGVVEQGRWRGFSDELVYPRRFFRSRFDPKRVYLATEFGLRALDLSGPSPTLSSLVDPDVAARVTTIVERGAGEVLAGTERHGLWRYRYDSAGGLVSAERIDVEAGIETGQVAELAVSMLPDGAVVASTRLGF